MQALVMPIKYQVQHIWGKQHHMFYAATTLTGCMVDFSMHPREKKVYQRENFLQPPSPEINAVAAAEVHPPTVRSSQLTSLTPIQYQMQYNNNRICNIFC